MPNPEDAERPRAVLRNATDAPTPAGAGADLQPSGAAEHAAPTLRAEPVPLSDSQFSDFAVV